MNAIQYLQHLRLTYYEAKVAMHLFRQSGTAREISNAIDVPFQKIYQIIKNLGEKGINVDFSAGEPKIFKKLEAAEILDYLLSKKREEFEWFKSSRADYLRHFEGGAEISANICRECRQELKKGEICFCEDYPASKSKGGD